MKNIIHVYGKIEISFENVLLKKKMPMYGGRGGWAMKIPFIKLEYMYYTIFIKLEGNVNEYSSAKSDNGQFQHGWPRVMTLKLLVGSMRRRWVEVLIPCLVNIFELRSET